MQGIITEVSWMLSYFLEMRIANGGCAVPGKLKTQNLNKHKADFKPLLDELRPRSINTLKGQKICA